MQCCLYPLNTAGLLGPGYMMLAWPCVLGVGLGQHMPSMHLTTVLSLAPDVLRVKAINLVRPINFIQKRVFIRDSYIVLLYVPF